MGRACEVRNEVVYSFCVVSTARFVIAEPAIWWALSLSGPFPEGTTPESGGPRVFVDPYTLAGCARVVYSTSTDMQPTEATARCFGWLF
jgi:hypothetical protein